MQTAQHLPASIAGTYRSFGALTPEAQAHRRCCKTPGTATEAL